MRIGSYTFEEFRQLAANFHGYAAPGLLVGAYMVEKAKAALPQGTLFEAVVESTKCLPDAVQLLTLCSTGNQRLKIINLGRYALTLFDKYTGEGIRAWLDMDEMAKWPELYSWFMKKKPKKEQDTAKLELEIRTAGGSICRTGAARVSRRFMGARHMASIGICPMCREAYPLEDGPVCRGCQGEAPYVSMVLLPERDTGPSSASFSVVPVEQSVGRIAAHDMTRIEPGQFKGPEFMAGQRIEAGDVCRLQRMGRFRVAVLDDEPPKSAERSGARDAGGEALHENVVAEEFAKRMAGEGVVYDLPPHEGKIDFKAARDGLFSVNEEQLARFNLVPHVMAACRQDASHVKKDSRLGGTRAIPLFLPRKEFEIAIDVLGEEPLFRVLPLRKAKTGILVTGTEVFNGIIEDKFIPVISAKVINLGCEVARTGIVPDDKAMFANAAREMLDAGIDLLITTGGLSVDPDDLTRSALMELGLLNAVHGVPVLPGTMSLVGNMDYNGRKVDVLGVPACALYFRTTFLDLALPRVLAGRGLSRVEASRMGSGGYCLSCKVCTWPKCAFGK